LLKLLELDKAPEGSTQPCTHAAGNPGCLCVDKKKAFVKCDANFSQNCICNQANTCTDVGCPSKDFNKYATDAGGAFYDTEYGETCGPYNESFSKSCSDDKGKEFATECPVGVTTNCRASWCRLKWCYVDPCTCDASDVTSSIYFGAKKIYYSYKTCGSADDAGYALAVGAINNNTKDAICYDKVDVVTDPGATCSALIVGAEHAGRQLYGITVAVLAMLVSM
jgi:hypothetical protein